MASLLGRMRHVPDRDPGCGPTHTNTSPFHPCVQTASQTTEHIEYCAQRIIVCVNHKHRTVTTTSAPVIVSETVDAVYGTIEAGGQLNAQVTGYVLNNAIRRGADQIGLSSGNRAPASPAASTPSGPASPAASTPSGPASPAASTPSGPAASATSTPSGPASPAASTPPRVTSPQILIMNDIENLVTRRGLFAINPDPTSPFLIETRPGFTDPGRFFGSDYFLSRVGGYAPEVLSKRLGDAFVETQLIREQLFQQTGRRLLKGFGSDLAQIKGLYDNALAVARAFQLTPGIQLTAAQVANLTHDIIWMEEMEVRGQRVLVPRVYLARVTRAHTDLASGRLIGNTVGIQTGLLHNTGAIEGRTRVALDTSLAIVNEGGLIASDGEVAIASAGTVANLSGLITGEHVTVQGQTILNDTQVMRDTRGTLGSQDFAYADRRQQRARISAGQTLTVTADDDIRSTGGTFQAGAALDLTAGGTVQLQARALETRLHLDEPEVTVNKFALRHEASRAKAGGAVTLRAGQDVVLVGADVVGGGDVTVDAGGAVIVQSVQDRDESAFKLSIKSGGLFGTKVNIEEHRTHTEVERSALKAGGALTVTARGGDVTLKAAELASGGQTELSADTGQVALLTETEIDYEQKKESDDSLLWFSTSDKGHHDETTVHVQIQASGGLTITTQDGVVVEYREAGTLDESLAQLAGTPGLDWLDELRGRDDVNWQAIQEAHEAWDHKAQGLTGVASALIAIAIALVTYGAGFEFALAQMGAVAEASAVTASTTLATAGQLAVAVAIDAGFTALVTQASLSLINNQGDLAAVFQHLGSLDTLTSLATSMAAAGLTYGALDQLGLAGTQTDLLAKMERTLVRATTRAGVQTALQGGNLGDNLVANLKTAGIAAVGAEAAGFIGQAYDHGNIDYATRLVAQAAVGCGMGAASGNCASGAGGAVIGEVAGDLYLQMQDAIRDPKNHKLDIAQLKQDGVNMARLVGGLTALVAGGDVTTAVQTAGNAAEQNAFRLVTLTLKAANKLGQIYRTTGKLTVQNLKDTGMVELVGMVDDLHTLFSSETSTVDKAGALFGLMIGIDFKDIRIAYSFATKVAKSAKGAKLAEKTGGHPSTPVGHRGKPLQVPPGTNKPATIDGRDYTGHALDRMQERGFTASVIEDTISRGTRMPGRDGATIFTTDQVRVILNPNGSVKTIIPQ